MTVSELLRELTSAFRSSGIADAHLEARLLAAYVLGMEASSLSPVSDAVVSEDACSTVHALAARRMDGEPIQYLLGSWEFMGLPFYVTKDALIPRADTEILCEGAARLIRERGYRTVLDLCCGTGCIGISLAKLTGAEVTAADISEACLRLTKKNAERNGVSVSVVKTDLFSAFEGKTFDLICCNPPYLTAEDIAHLQREVCFEPSLALYGGTDGLDFYRRLAAEAYGHLNPNGAVLLEIGCTQAEAVASLFETETVWKDYAGNPRVVFAEAK